MRTRDRWKNFLAVKKKVFGFFVGKMMRELKGKASPDAVREALVKEIVERKSKTVPMD